MSAGQVADMSVKSTGPDLLLTQVNRRRTDRFPFDEHAPTGYSGARTQHLAEFAQSVAECGLGAALAHGTKGMAVGFIVFVIFAIIVAAMFGPQIKKLYKDYQESEAQRQQHHSTAGWERKTARKISQQERTSSRRCSVCSTPLRPSDPVFNWSGRLVCRGCQRRLWKQTTGEDEPKERAERKAPGRPPRQERPQPVPPPIPQATRRPEPPPRRERKPERERVSTHNIQRPKLKPRQQRRPEPVEPTPVDREIMGARTTADPLEIHANDPSPLDDLLRRRSDVLDGPISADIEAYDQPSE